MSLKPENLRSGLSLQLCMGLVVGMLMLACVQEDLGAQHPDPINSAEYPTSDYVILDADNVGSTPEGVIYDDESSWPVDSSGFINFDSPFSFQMLDFQNRQGDKEVFLLEHATRYGDSRSLTVGTQFRARACSHKPIPTTSFHTWVGFQRFHRWLGIGCAFAASKSKCCGALEFRRSRLF